MKRFFLIGALVFTAVSQIHAADLPQAPAAYVPLTAPVYNWGGIYFGANGGYAFGTSQWNPNPGGASTADFDISGFLAGATLGANVQADAFVFGIDGDINASGITGSPSAVNCAGFSCTTKNDWFATARVRIGYAVERVLLYGTAGGAFGNVEGELNGTTTANITKAGWTAGAGIEAAFADNWTARVEYLYVALQNASFANGTPTLSTTVSFDANIIRVGLDYKFR